MKNQKQLQELIELARTQSARGVLVGHQADSAEATTTKSWGPQMRV